MHNRPDHPTLLEALATFLSSDVMPKLEADKALQFRTVIAANLATVIAAELRTMPERLALEGQRLAALLKRPTAPKTLTELEQLNAQLAHRLAAGELVDRETLNHLLLTARETLLATNPRFQVDQAP
jgi:Domain of unknown function (DUF6285)